MRLETRKAARKSRMLSALTTLAAIVIGGYVLLVVALYFFQERLVYFPSGAIVATPALLGLTYEDVAVTTEDGVSLHGWFIPAKESKVTVLFFHGNGGNISFRMETIRILHSLGLDLLLFDYRGYGKSEGTPGEQGTYKDATAIWNYLASERNIPANNIVLMGRSLGGAVASWLAEIESPRCLILESSFTSLADIGADVYPFIPVRMLSRIQYSTIERIKNIRCPILVVHSPQDEIIPFHHGEELFSAAHPPKEFLRITGGHNDGFIISEKIYAEGIRSFIMP